jgi:putative transposase
MSTRQPYPTDLTDAQWGRLEPYLPAANKDCRPREVPVRDILDAYFYLLRAGCSWRMLPHDFPKWKTVYSQVRRWKQAGVWEAVHARVREDVRWEVEGKPAEPSAAALDSQTVKAADHAGERGYDAGKKKSSGGSGMCWLT